MGAPSGFDAAGFDLAFQWRHPGQPVICQVARSGDEVLFEYPDIASFVITRQADIFCIPTQRCQDALLRHLLLNQVIPRWLASQGCALLHASAVWLPDVGAVGFLGKSGVGKSTLAASFAENGALVLADDCIMLKADPIEKSVQAIGAYPGLRLWPGTPGLTSRYSSVHSGTVKKQAVFHETCESNSQRLSALFVLTGEDVENEGCHIDRLTGAEALMALLHESLALDPSTSQSSEQALMRFGEVLETGVPVASLTYHRAFARLPEVRAAVVNWLQVE
ncbi:hypothetical protein F3N42_01440 [Marinihelvus fidelis]|uniref:HPr kinase/phosphorylase C-terminal domain-containing protein n=1 Tax=Marinihelvus fidelis TaxID=2613842 RepID=A0A5N0TDF3_9GAMM|nr:hypothetical protein [Marinihelvus fidelis]KAA9133052.1 hypothetical protein F3N42_01440 [Marinihelvus fidelis]